MQQNLTLSFRRWFYGIDRWVLIGVLVLIFIGFLMVLSAGPYAARRIGAPGFSFLKKYLVYAMAFLPVLFFFSMQTKKRILQFSVIGLGFSWILTVLTLGMGVDIKGASRWIDLGGFGLQPSELMKPFFIIVQAFILVKIKNLWTENCRQARQWLMLHLGLVAGTILPLLLQPDIGMTSTFLIVWALMIFVAGLPWRYMILLTVAFGAAGILFYHTFGHFKSRMDRFLYPENADTYQIDKAIQAVENGGWFPSIGNGYIKESLPDSHADFVFVVFVEEFGALLSLMVISLYLFIFLRGLKGIRRSKDDWVVLSGTGLLGLFIFQAFFNIASNLSLVPTKGMTLPFLSYGGSSFLCFVIVFGILLSCLRED